MLTARDKKQKLAGKSLTEHLRRKHGAITAVGAALMLNKIKRDDNPTDSDDSGTDITCSDSDYKQGDSDFEFAAAYCA